MPCQAERFCMLCPVSNNIITGLYHLFAIPSSTSKTLQVLSIPMLSTQIQHANASRQAAQLGKAAALSFVRTASSSSSLLGCPAVLRVGCAASQQHRLFSSTPATQLRDFFPVKETAHIQKTKPAWPHHAQTYEEMAAVVPAHREPRTKGDWVAWKIVRLARWCMDKATGMDREQQVDKKHPTTSVVAQKPLTEAQWVCITSLP